MSDPSRIDDYLAAMCARNSPGRWERADQYTRFAMMLGVAEYLLGILLTEDAHEWNRLRREFETWLIRN